MASRRWGSITNNVLTVILLVAVAFVLFRPQGLIGAKIREYRQDAAARKQIEVEWQALVIGPRADANPDDVPVVVVFSDYQCPACRAAHTALTDLVQDGSFGVVYRHIPSPRLRPMSAHAAAAAICSEAWGRFATTHRWLFETAEWQDGSVVWSSVAPELGIPDSAGFADCVTQSSTFERIDRDLDLAKRLSIGATPTFIGRGGVHTGVPTPEAIQRILR